jgi:hypothetical protein
MNFGKGGQNIVQAGSGGGNVFRGSGGNILGAYFGMKLRRQERDYHREQDYAARKDFEDYKNTSKVKHDTLSDMIRPAAAAHGAAEAYRIANETLGKDHPDVVAGLKPANTPKHPEMAHQVNNYGFDVGYRPAKTPPSKIQSDSIAERLRGGGEEITKQSDASGASVARFGKDGKITHEPVSYEDIGVEESFSERPPASMSEVDESTRPSNQTFTNQQKADLENERPRTTNLNNGINDGKGGNY